MSDPVRQLGKVKPRSAVITREVRLGSNEKATSATTSTNDSKQTSSTTNENEKLVAKIWKQIDSEYEKAAKNQNLKNTVNKGTAHKAIRIFVSSTFTDFFNEREVLVKEVFPELKEWCALRNLDLVECDLRWGVPTDSTNDETILTCLSELDRCYQDNGEYPFFIGMLSERYGWIPNVQNLNHNIIEKYSWMPDVSITFMEYLHGAIRSKNQNACFFIRRPESLAQIPEKYKDKFFDKDELSKCHLKKLKAKLKEYFPEQTFEYSCSYDGIDDSTGREKIKLTGYDEFASQVLKFFKAAIERTYPDNKPIENNENKKEEDLIGFYEIEDFYQKSYINEKLNFYVPRPNDEDAVKRFIKNESLPQTIQLHVNEKNDDDNNDEKVDETVVSESRYLLVSGVEGSGKTSILAQLLFNAKDDIFYHFFDASINAGYLECMAARFIIHFTNILKSQNIETSNWLQTFFENYATAVREDILNEIISLLSRLNKNYVIILDGLDRCESDRLFYFPRSLPKNITSIVSVDMNSKRLIRDLMEIDRWYRFDLSNFNIQTSELFIKNYLERYNKRLDDKQLKLLLEKQTTTLVSPLWLNFACYELRVFGDHATLSKKIESLPDNVNGILSHIFLRLNKEIGNDLIKKTLCFIEVSHIGIPENEVTILLGDFINRQELDRLKWAQLTRQLKPFLRYTYIDRKQFISFVHKSLHAVVNDIFLENNKEIENKYRSLLGDFYQYYSKNRPLACEQACYHIQSLNDNSRLVDFLRSKECQIYIQGFRRSEYFDNIRCRNFIFPHDQQNKLLMCFACAGKFDKYFVRINKDSCFLCRGQLFPFDAHEAHFCMNHYFKFSSGAAHFFCCICNIASAKNSTLKPTVARLCFHCNFKNKCCHITNI